MRTFMYESEVFKVIIEIVDMEKGIVPVKLIIFNKSRDEEVLKCKCFTLLNAEDIASAYLRRDTVTTEVK